MYDSINLSEYLFTRLKQLGVGAVHGVPGDYNLTLLDYIEPAGLFWVGNANELNAGYAADGYARIKGMGAFVTTYGVGELSAINAVAGAFAERSPVVHVVGTPARNSQENRKMIHHTLGDGEFRHFQQIYSHVTVAQANLMDPRTSPQQIDEVLMQCLLHRRPVYIEIPVDMVDAPVNAKSLDHKIQVPELQTGPVFEEVRMEILERLQQARRPIIIVDGETRALGLLDSVQRFVETTKLPTFTTVSGKSLVDMSLSNVYGIFRGDFADQRTKCYVEGADLAFVFGPHLSSTNTYNWSSIPEPEITIAFTQAGINLGGTIHRDLPLKKTISSLLEHLDHLKLKAHSAGLDLPRDQLLHLSELPDEEVVKQDRLWRVLANILRPGDILLGETGTAGHGVREMPLPRHVRLFSPVTWLSIGFMLPASQGAALAQRELVEASNYHGIDNARTILLIGDGSFQMTVQELSTIIRHNLNVVIFLLNNDGYTIERCIHGINQGYNDIGRWSYLNAPPFFGASESTYTGTIRTYGDLKKILEDKELTDGQGLRMVEVHMDRNDAPAGPLLKLINRQKA